MKQKIYNTFLYLIIILSLISCEQNQPNFPIKYVRSSLVSGELRLFTKGVEIKNNDSISRFISNFDKQISENPATQIISFNNADLAYDKYNFDLEILSNTKARLIYYNDSIVNLYTQTIN